MLELRNSYTEMYLFSSEIVQFDKSFEPIVFCNDDPGLVILLSFQSFPTRPAWSDLSTPTHCTGTHPTSIRLDPMQEQRMTMNTQSLARTKWRRSPCLSPTERSSPTPSPTPPHTRRTLPTTAAAGSCVVNPRLSQWYNIAITDRWMLLYRPGFLTLVVDLVTDIGRKKRSVSLVLLKGNNSWPHSLVSSILFT